MTRLETLDRIADCTSGDIPIDHQKVDGLTIVEAARLHALQCRVWNAKTAMCRAVADMLKKDRED